MEKPNPNVYNSKGFYLDDLEKYNNMMKKNNEVNEDWRGCICKYLNEPCSDSCTCVNGFSSSGCIYCATYGSLEQRKKAAQRIKEWIDAGREAKTNEFVSKKEVASLLHTILNCSYVVGLMDVVHIKDIKISFDEFFGIKEDDKTF